MRGGLLNFYVRIRDCAEASNRFLMRVSDLDKITKNDCNNLLTQWGCAMNLCCLQASSSVSRISYK